MKNKIIAIFTACCMICGAFTFDTVNTIDTADNTVNATAVDNTQHEIRNGELILRPYGYSPPIYVSELDSYRDGGYSYYTGDSTSDIDWSKHTDIHVDGYGISAQWNESLNDIEISLGYNGYSLHTDVIISFEDMEFIISIDYVMLTTVPITTMTTTSYHTTTVKPSTTTTTTPAPSLMIIPSSVNMKTGSTNKLAVIGASNLSDVIWTSGDTSVATVSENGTVTAEGSGSTLIYAVYNGNVASCKITVNADKSIVYGDANGDGSVDIADATAIVQSIGNPDEYALSEQGRANSDTNGDGVVTGADAIIIQKVVTGQYKITDLPVKE